MGKGLEGGNRADIGPGGKQAVLTILSFCSLRTVSSPAFSLQMSSPKGY